MSLNDVAREIHERWVNDKDHRDETRAFAREAAADFHAELKEEFGGMSHKQLAEYVDLAREEGRDDAVARADIWALAVMTPQRITGRRG